MKEMKADHRKQSLYFPYKMLEEVRREAARLDRSISWLVQYAWERTLDEVVSLPPQIKPKDRKFILGTESCTGDVPIRRA